MPITVPLAEFLALPAIAAASPLVLTGDPGTCPVRWAHSSEVFEIGPLLRGGELLLTTGLGLRGASPSDLERYVDTLANAGIAALALELGRTFAEVPAAMVEAADRRQVVLVALHEVVPFEVYVEAFHELVKDRELGALWQGERIWRELLDVVLEGQGIQALVQRIADLSGRPAVLRAQDRRLVAASVEGDEPLDTDPQQFRPVEVGSELWGTLHLSGDPTDRIAAVLDRAPRALALELLRTGAAHDRLTLATGLLRDIVNNRLPSRDELRSRCTLAGFPVRDGDELLAVAVAGDRRMARRGLATAALEASRAGFGSALAGEIDEEVILVVRMPSGGQPALRHRLDQLTDRLSETVEQATGHTIVAVGAGSVAGDLEQLAQSIIRAHEVVSIARRLGTRQATVLARDFGIYRLLSHFQAEPQLSMFLREQLGPLLDHDAAHGTELLHTLDIYLRHGQVKSDAAAALSVRRQTLYNRLARIDKVLGPGAVTDHERLTALNLALHVWRLRTGVLPAS